MTLQASGQKLLPLTCNMKAVLSKSPQDQEWKLLKTKDKLPINNTVLENCGSFLVFEALFFCNHKIDASGVEGGGFRQGLVM